MTQKYTIGAGSYELPTREISPANLAESSFLVANDAANTFATAKRSIVADGFLSSAGKHAKLLPLVNDLWRQVFTSTENIGNEAAYLDKRELKLFAVPEITTPFEIARDLEIRTWFRGLTRAEKSAVLERISSGQEQQHTVAALLRSPVALALDQELALVAEAHKSNCIAQNPDEWDLIQAGRESVEWAERGMGHVRGIAHGLTERNETEVMQLALTSGHEAAAMLMFGDSAVANALRIIKNESRKAA